MPPAVKRILISLLAGLAVGAVITEVSFHFLREVDRSPEVIVLTIPRGTADLVAAGVEPPSIPSELIFIVGDVLIVKNQDDVPHELGPLFIPPNSSAHMSFESTENYSFSCSFQPDNSIGLDVREPVTPYTRFIGILFAGLPMGGLIALYSLVVRPLKPRDQPS